MWLSKSSCSEFSALITWYYCMWGWVNDQLTPPTAVENVACLSSGLLRAAFPALSSPTLSPSP